MTTCDICIIYILYIYMYYIYIILLRYPNNHCYTVIYSTNLTRMQQRNDHSATEKR